MVSDSVAITLDTLRCMVCRLLYIAPVVLPSCGHSMCRLCSKECVYVTKTCPMCRKPVDGPPTPNYALNDIVLQAVTELNESAQKEYEQRALASITHSFNEDG